MIEPEKKRSDLEEILAAFIIIISCFFVFTYFLALVLGPVIFFSTPEGVAANVTPIENGLLIWLFMVVFFHIPIMPNLGEVFVFLVGVFFLCLLAAWRFRENFQNVIRKGSSRPVGKLFNNFLVAMPIITSMLLTAVLAIISLQSSVGLPTEPSPTTKPPLIQFFSFSYAAFIEEIGFRISPIGLLLIFRVFEARLRNRIMLSGKGRLKLFFTALVYPDQAKKAVGMKTVSEFGIRGGISRGEWTMIFLTSFAFAIAHPLSGWSAAKFTTAFVDGLAFGLVYIAYGAYAPILLHWFFNYYLSIFELDISLKYYPYLLPIGSLAVLLMLAVGIGGWIVFTIIGVKKLLKLKAKPPRPVPSPLVRT